MTELRVSTFNASLNRTAEGQLITDLSTPDNAQAQTVAEIIQRTNPDILLINEFDFDENQEAINLFRDNYLEVSQAEGVDPVDYPFVYQAPSNTGIPTGFDLNNNGTAVTTVGEAGYGDDAFGFGFYPGQFGMVLLSKYPIVEEDIRTFQNFRWVDMPGALLPDDAATEAPGDFYSEEELAIFRLSSKSHWDVPVDVNGETVHILASHPTPPVFDGAEDRNGLRNHDEIRLWADYITPGAADYLYDDAGNFGGLAPGASFVILGDQNADPFDGDSADDAILQLLNNPAVNVSTTPSSTGGPDANDRQGSNNLDHLGDSAYDTADFGESPFGPGNLRADYVLPSIDLEILEASIFWPTSEEEEFALVGDFPFPSSDHRLVYTDLETTPALPPNSRQNVSALEFLGEVTFATGFTFEATEVGGLSGLTYDEGRDLYYAISDDRSSINPARFYDLTIDLTDGTLDDGDVAFTGVTTLLNAAGESFPALSLDPEGIALTSLGTLFITSEGDANALVNPFVNEFSLSGQQIRELPVPEKFFPTADQSSGIRNNLAFESATVTPNQRFLYTATENALYQDGPAAGLDQESLSRILQYDLTTGEVSKEFLYETDAVAVDSNPPGGFITNGLVELLALDDTGTLLALERSFSLGVGNSVRLYEVLTQNTTDLRTIDGVDGVDVDAIAEKRLLLDLGDLGITLDNLEALAFGPTLPNGDQSLIIVSDNNFNAVDQFTQFLAFGVDLEGTPAVAPRVETPNEVRFGSAANPDPTLESDPDDPAIYVHPTDPSQSFVITSLKNTGLKVYDLEGQELQTIFPEGVRYNNVDLVYGFEVNGEAVDLAIASDRQNDTLAIFAIDPATRTLTDITDTSLSDAAATVFGLDDGEQTAYGLTTYTSPVDGKSYVFVSQRDGDQIAQLELFDNGGTIGATVVRTFTVPLPPEGDTEDGQVEGMVVDRELGYLYVAEEGLGILKFSAEPNGGDAFTIVDTVNDIKPEGSDRRLAADAEGLTLYYGADGAGYLIASSQGDSTFAVYDRQGSNSYLGSFAVEDGLGIDGAEESDGADVINVPLGDAFPFGLLVVQDGSNDEPVVFGDPEDGEIQNFNANFKYVAFEDVAALAGLDLNLDTESYDPRNPEARTLINGVASGDTTQDTTVLWARSTAPGEVLFEYGTDASFSTVVATVTAQVTAIDTPVKVEIGGLEPGTDYFYRVTDAAGDVAIGEFETSAALGTQTGLRFGVSGDWRGELAPYPAIANAAERDLAFFVEHGDTIYADFPSDAVKNDDGTPKAQVETLEEYRAKHGEVYDARFGLNTWAELRASTSILATIDDHEVINDFGGGVDVVEDDRFTDAPGTLINDSALYEVGLQAFQEYNPLRDEFYGETGDPRFDGERELYRFNTYGSDAAVMVLDTRSFRDEDIAPPLNPFDPLEVAGVLAATFEEGRTLLGEVQLNDLKEDLLTAQADGITWKFVMVPEPIQNIFPGINTDAFEGYSAERTELLSFINENAIENVVFVAADVHTTFVNNLTYQEAAFGPQIPTSVFEITTGAVAFDAPTGEFLADAFFSADPATRAFYDSLPVAPDTDSLLNDRDDLVEQTINDALLTPGGFDPLGLDNNLPEAEGFVQATLLQGDYFVGHTYGWTEFDIDPLTQQLTVTTYGIDAYSEAEVLEDPNAILNLEPTIVSQFIVAAAGDRELVFGTPDSDILFPIVGDNDIYFTDGGDDDIDLSLTDGNNRVVAGSGQDIVLLSRENNLVFGGSGEDLIDTTGSTGNSRLYGGSEADTFVAGATGDVFFGGDEPDGTPGDLFLALDSQGDNRFIGGAGDDTFSLGSGDRVLGGSGNDTFELNEGSDNLISGGAGADVYLITSATAPAAANVIVDFSVLEDQIQVGAATTLNVVESGSNTLITLEDGSPVLELRSVLAIALLDSSIVTI